MATFFSRGVVDAASLISLSSLLRFTLAANPDQIPLGAPRIPSPVSHQTPHSVASLVPSAEDNKQAKVLLWPGSRTHPDDLRAMGLDYTGCAGKDSADSDGHGDAESMSFQIDTCISGEYYFHNNMMVSELPSCPDGSAPKLLVYSSRECAGSTPRVVDDIDALQHKCLWSDQDEPTMPYYWSFILRCSETATEIRDHHSATLPLVNSFHGANLPGFVRHHRSPMWPCHSDWGNTTNVELAEPGVMQWDSVHPSGKDAFGHQLAHIEIVAPAICSDGRRAQLLFYRDPEQGSSGPLCPDEASDFEHRLLDVHDWSLNTCIDMSRIKLRGDGFGRAMGYMFTCDGLQSAARACRDGKTMKKPLEVVEFNAPLGPRVSHSECAVSGQFGQWRQLRPATYFSPAPDTCISLPEKQYIRLREAPPCQDGSQARLASWEQPGCQGWPSMIDGISQIITNNCHMLSTRQETSYKFWCGPQGVTKEEREQGEFDARAVISPNECESLDLKPGWTRIGMEAGPKIERIEAESCFTSSRNQPWKMFANAKCQNGAPAKLIKYERRWCKGESESFVVDEGMLDSCMPLCEGKTCAFKFACEQGQEEE